jgi:hypothetical protein
MRDRVPMPISKDDERWLSRPLLILPSIYVIAILLTAALSVRMPGGAYYRIIGIDPVAGMFGMVYDSDAILVGAFLIFGTPWWYLMGRIALNSKNRKFSSWGSGAAAVLAFFTCFVATSMSTDVLKQDIREGPLTAMAILQYSLVAFLCFGSLVSTIYATIAVFARNRPSLR